MRRVRRRRLPELYSLKGELVLTVPKTNGGDAESCYQQAFDAAQEIDGRMMQLRAALGLCRSQRDQRVAQRGTELLRAVYATFREGFAMPDLIEAGELLKNV